MTLLAVSRDTLPLHSGRGAARIVDLLVRVTDVALADMVCRFGASAPHVFDLNFKTHVEDDEEGCDGFCCLSSVD